MSRSLDDLDSRFRPFAEELHIRANQLFPTLIIDTLRTEAEHQANLAGGVSRAKRSLHLPQPPEGKSLAIDLAPAECMALKQWAPRSPLWDRLAAIGEALAVEMRLRIRWGGTWKELGVTAHAVGARHKSFPDPGHFEYLGQSIDRLT